MFVKLTKIDGSPIWINASYVVTIEQGRGGSVVVPIGDGLDYDVREKPERVLELLSGAPVPAIVPVPAVDALAPTRPDLLPEPQPAEAAPAPAAAAPEAPKVEEPAPKAKRTRKTAAKPRTKKAAAVPAEDPEAEVRADEPKAAAQAEEPEAVAPVDVFAASMPRVTASATLPDDQVERLRKMAPRTMKKLLNTLVTQFHGVAPEAVVAELAAHGVIAVDGTRIQWR